MVRRRLPNYSKSPDREEHHIPLTQSPEVSLVVDASVGLKWVLDEPDSHWAEALARGDEELLMPDFWLHEATNVCWLQVRKQVWTPEEAREGLALLKAQVPPTSTGELDLHGVALGLGMAVNHSTYDTLYVAFAVAMGARGIIAADSPFVRDMRRHPDSALAAMVIPLADWAADQGRG